VDDAQYGVMSEACADGWAAFVRHGERLTLLRQRPHSHTRFDFSTVSEPVAPDKGTRMGVQS
jgi:hypothetical protein